MATHHTLRRPLHPSNILNPYKPHTLHPHSLNNQPIRHASLIRRPRRPYTFTQLVTLSDGSTYTHRTTSPAPIYVSTKDTRNSPLWNPSSQKLMNAESDEEGRLRRFREKFGRGFDVEGRGGEMGGDGEGRGGGREERRMEEGGEGGEGVVLGDGGRTEGQSMGRGKEGEEDNIMDLISGYGREAEERGESAGVREGKKRSGKGKGGEK